MLVVVGTNMMMYVFSQVLLYVHAGQVLGGANVMHVCLFAGRLSGGTNNVMCVCCRSTFSRYRILGGPNLVNVCCLQVEF